MTLTRRHLLRGAATAAALPALARCDGGSSDGDALPDLDAPLLPELALTKAPWVFQTGPRSALLRFETREARALPVTVVVGDTTRTLTPALSSFDLTYANDNYDRDDILPDEEGTHVLQDVVLDDLEPGEVVAWSVDAGGGVRWEGSFTHRPPRGTAARVAWLADTMWPNTDATVARIAELAPDLIFHGGDLQYRDNPLDTWNGFFASMRVLTAIAPVHACVGNHEDEKAGELEQMFDRLFAAQGWEGRGVRQHVFDVSGVRFIALDSETDGFNVTDAPQYAWLAEQLAAADADADVRAVVVGFHRPIYSFSKHFDSNPAKRDALVAALDSPKVVLVLAGHAHCVEHFEADGLHWVVDGTGGSFLYDPDQQLIYVEEVRPELLAQRKFKEKVHGTTVIDIAADGVITVSRHHAEDGAVSYSFTIPVPTA